MSWTTRAGLLYLLLTLPLTFGKNDTIQCPPPGTVNPANDPCNLLGYVPSDVLTSIAVVAFGLVTLSHAINFFRRGAKWMWAMIIGGCTMTFGLALRYSLHNNPDSRGVFIAETLLIILSPTTFIAADYVLLGRLTTHLDAHKYLLVAPRRIATIFLISDVITFLIQGGGGGLTTSNDVSTAKLGTHITLVGLILQTVSFALFIAVFVNFVIRVRKHDPFLWERDSKNGFFNDWRGLALALFISCIGIAIRSIYRLIEFSQGPKGSLSQNEGTFFGLDSLPLLIAIAVYVPYWPGRFIGDAANYGSIPMANIQK